MKPTVGFRSNEFGYVALTFGVAHFPTGATVTNEVRDWIGPKVSITLQKYGSSLTEGRARFQVTGL